MLYAYDKHFRQLEVEEYEIDISEDQWPDYEPETYLRDEIRMKLGDGYTTRDIITHYFEPGRNIGLLLDIYQKDEDGNEIPDTRMSACWDKSDIYRFIQEEL